MENEVKYKLTPKGFFAFKLEEYGIEFKKADELWHMLEAFCLRRMKEEFPDAEYPAIVFDGNGGVVIGLNNNELED